MDADRGRCTAAERKRSSRSTFALASTHPHDAPNAYPPTHRHRHPPHRTSARLSLSTRITGKGRHKFTPGGFLKSGGANDDALSRASKWCVLHDVPCRCGLRRWSSYALLRVVHGINAMLYLVCHRARRVRLCEAGAACEDKRTCTHTRDDPLARIHTRTHEHTHRLPGAVIAG